MTPLLKHQFIATFLLIAAGSTLAQRQTCLNGFVCVNSQQFRACDGGRPINCPMTEEGQTICFGGDIGYGASDEDVGPCIPRPNCSQRGSFPLAIPGDTSPEMCSGFFKCMSSSLGQLQASGNVCDTGSEFSSRSGECAAAAVAGCSRGLPAAAATNAPAPASGENSEQVDEATTESPEQVDKTTTESQSREQNGFECERNGRAADPESCRHFYSCSNRGMRRVACPRGLYFNEQWRVCWFRVNCGDRMV